MHCRLITTVAISFIQELPLYKVDLNSDTDNERSLEYSHSVPNLSPLPNLVSGRPPSVVNGAQRAVSVAAQIMSGKVPRPSTSGDALRPRTSAQTSALFSRPVSEPSMLSPFASRAVGEEVQDTTLMQLANVDLDLHELPSAVLDNDR